MAGYFAHSENSEGAKHDLIERLRGHCIAEASSALWVIGLRPRYRAEFISANDAYIHED